MATQEQINDARELLKQKWDSEGQCGSCGWHAALYEHDVEDYEIAEALDGDGEIHLTCQNDDVGEERFNHRGVKIVLRPNTEISGRGDEHK